MENEDSPTMMLGLVARPKRCVTADKDMRVACIYVLGLGALRYEDELQVRDSVTPSSRTFDSREEMLLCE